MKQAFIPLLLILLVFGVWKIFFAQAHDPRSSLGAFNMRVSIVENGREFPFENVSSQTIESFLLEKGFALKPEDAFFPERGTVLQPGMRILYAPARAVSIRVDGSERKVNTLEKTAGEILRSAEVILDEDDLVAPAREALVAENGKIVVTRVEIKEEKKSVPIPFSTKEKEDDKLSWRKKTVEQKGVDGVKETTYRVSYHNGREVNRRIVSVVRTKEPVDEIVTQGTLVKTGKSHTGAASWYAWTGTMAAANPWLPMGSYVRVTNKANGKSVIVKINDRGPFVPGRIIDLDRVAFEKIASVGAGVIDVKMEEITN